MKRAGLVAALPLGAFAALSAFSSSQQLAELPTRGAIRPGAAASALGALGLLLTIAVYALLGRHVLRGGGNERDALWAGAICGTVAGVCGSVLTALGVRDYLDAVLTTYAVPREQLIPAVLAVYVVLWTSGSTVFGSVAAWFALRWWRSRAGSAGS
ncbi:MAG: hypothetical protein HY071_02870 [Chloroflexi bacterium]|nr:hypothetical protein [Chloroflexota bacterium]